MMRSFYNILFAGFGGFLLAFGFLFPTVGPILGVIGFVPLFFSVRESGTYGRAFVRVFFSGLVFFGISLNWLFATLPLDWAGIQSSVASTVIFGCVWVCIIIGFALPWGIFGVGLRFLHTQTRTALVYASCAAAVWVVCEYARSFVFGLLWVAPGQSVIGPDWTFSSITFLFAHTPAVAFARWGGMHLIDFLVALMGAFLYVLLVRFWEHKKFFLAGASAVAVLGGFFLTAYGMQWLDSVYIYPLKRIAQAPKVKVAVLNMNFSKRLYFSPEERQKKYDVVVSLLKSIPEKIDIAVLPEIAEFTSQGIRDPVLLEKMRSDDILLVDHGYSARSGQSIPQTIYWRAGSGVFAFQTKELLMPGGEYLPWVLVEGLRLAGQGLVVDAYQGTRTVYKGVKVPVVQDRLGVFSSILCSEMMSPRIIRRSARAGAQVFFAQTSDAIFQGNDYYLNQMLAMARLRAVETGRFIARSSNAGIPAFIDPYGRIVSSLPKGEGVLVDDIPLLAYQTPYTRFGDWPVLASALFLVLWGAHKARTYQI